MTTLDIPDSVRCWKIGDGASNVGSWNSYQDNQGYNLFCQTNGKFLTWGKMPLGINLTFTENPKLMKTHFQLPDGAERDIFSGELVAFGIGGGEAFLRYAPRDVGVNLKWSDTPVFEWRLFGGDTGTPIQENSPVAIVNDKVEPAPDFFIYFDRPPGLAEVGWTTSPGFWDSVIDLADKHKVDIAKAVLVAL